MNQRYGLLRQAAQTAAAVPQFVISPLIRPWHLRWGATDDEAGSAMPGDGLVPKSHFTATRAITIDAPPEAVWPWVMQVGFNRAGFYSYDLLDSLGKPSADTILSDLQQLRVGDTAAPMTADPSAATSFTVAEEEYPLRLVWAKPDSSWSWQFNRLRGDRTRLVTRLKQRYRPGFFLLPTVLLLEFGDFPMMKKMLKGIKARAEGRPLA